MANRGICLPAELTALIVAVVATYQPLKAALQSQQVGVSVIQREACINMFKVRCQVVETHAFRPTPPSQISRRKHIASHTHQS